MQNDSFPQQKIIQGESISFKIFNDGQFLHQKKQHTSLAKTNRKVIKSLNIFIATNIKTQNNELKGNSTEPHEKYTKKLSHQQGKNKPQISICVLSDKKKNWDIVNNRRQSEKQKILIKKSRQQRYEQSQNSQTQQQDSGQISARQCKNDKRIRVLKRILEHYNTKAPDFKSNLISKWDINFNNSNLLGPPKTAVRRERSGNYLSQNKQQSAKSIQSCGKRRRLDVFDNYFNHNKITVEAQGINQLIKQKENPRKRVSTSVNQTRKPTKISNYSNSPVKKNIQKYQTMPAEPPKIVDSYNQNCISTKVNKFRQFIFLLNCAHKVYRELDIQKYQQPFKIYIGNGNNRNLVKAIMKRRFWFQITKNAKEAHFVWTQLKEQNMYERQSEIKELKEQRRINKMLTNRPSTSYMKSNQDDILIETKHTDNLEINLEDSAISSKAINLTRNTARDHKQHKIMIKRNKQATNNRPENRLLTKQQLNAHRQLMAEVGVRKKTIFRDRIFYLKNFSTLDFDDLSAQIVHNHLPANGLLGNKKAMYYMLRQYCRLTQKSIFDFVPLTYHIRSGFQDEQYKQFSMKFMQNRMSSHPNYWVIKPGQFSNRGQGIQCTNKLEEVKKRLTKIKNNKNKSLIIQQYITNPLLYNGRKFDIRTFMLISVNNGIMRGYWYQDGYVRTSSQQWSLKDMDDSEVHLTNDAIQKYSGSYGKYQPGNKLTYTELQRYLDNLPKDNPKPAVNFMKDIYPQIKGMAADTIKSTFCYLDPERKGDNFQVFGFDFMIDNKFKPWLIEINTNPCLQMSCPVLDRIIPSMLQNAFRIGLDPLFPVPLNYSSNYKYSIPENALHYNKFQLIFDEQRDGPGLWQLYKESTILKEMDEYQQDKEVYEQDGEQIDLDQS